MVARAPIAAGAVAARRRHSIGGLDGWRVRALAPLVAVVVLSLLAAAPLFRGGMIPGHDANEHVTRTAEFARALAAGVWWPWWAPNLGHGYGEPIFLFNPPLFYMLAAVPTLVGVPLVASVNLATALLLVVAGLGMYAWTAPRFGRAGAAVAAVAYAWAPYVLLDVYIRQALTELTAVCILPWALWGITRAGRAPGPRAVATGGLVVGLLLLASTPATLVAAPALLGQVVALVDRRRPWPFAAGLAALAVGVLLAAVFWVPAAAERHLLHFERLLNGRVAYTDSFLEPVRLVSPYWGPGVNRRGPDERLMGFGLGEAQLALALTGLAMFALRRPDGEIRRQALLAGGLVVVGAAMTLKLSAPIWQVLPPLHFLQFPWRFLLLPALGCAALAALPTALLARSRPRAGAVLAAACIGLLVIGGWRRAQPPAEPIPYPEERFSAAAVASRERGRGTVQEYETIWTVDRPDDPPSARAAVVSGPAALTELTATAHEQRFSVATARPARVRLNTYYFPGWRVMVDGRERPIEWDNPAGLIEFGVEAGESLIVARFEATPARWLGGGLSLVGLMLVIVLLARPAHGRWRTGG